MAQTATRHRTGNADGESPTSAWAMGASVFAGSMMVLVGILQFFEGLIALLDGSDFLLRTSNYVFQLDSTVWGWTHLVIGVLVAAAGAFIFTGSAVARGVGILLAS